LLIYWELRSKILSNKGKHSRPDGVVVPDEKVCFYQPQNTFFSSDLTVVFAGAFPVFRASRHTLAGWPRDCTSRPPSQKRHTQRSQGHPTFSGIFALQLCDVLSY
jgi:hypothetical protein